MKGPIDKGSVGTLFEVYLVRLFIILDFQPSFSVGNKKLDVKFCKQNDKMSELTSKSPRHKIIILLTKMILQCIYTSIMIIKFFTAKYYHGILLYHIVISMRFEPTFFICNPDLNKSLMIK